ncbi:MAG: DNA adenine methylase [Candidatus Hydrogenedentes bacterium]|nr:DNA adenine methylase [Candidatus Hydrogenedentota bacterium]
MPRPFLKWAGGKTGLLAELLERVEAAQPFSSYFEPFIGGGALFFELARLGRLPGCAVLSDANVNLVSAYLGVRDHVDAVIRALLRHKSLHSRDHYYAVRDAAPRSLPARAARVIYLNRTCFNGLYRENSRGRFNVPMGRYKNPRICDESNLRACSKALQPAQLAVKPFQHVLDAGRTGDFVYFDPPYHPLSKTSSFTSYDRAGFGEKDQRLLADVFAQLSARGVKCLLSNSMTDLVRHLYADFTIEEVYAPRHVNSRPDRRGKIPEALIRNF